MSAIRNDPGSNPYEALNVQAKSKGREGFAVSENGNFLLIRQREGSKISRTLVDISKIPEITRREIQSRIATMGNPEGMENLKKELQSFIKPLKERKAPGVETVEYKSYSRKSTKAAANEKLQRMMGLPMASEVPVRIRVGETEYAVPAKAITEAGANPDYVTGAIQHGKELLDAINALPERTEGETYESPIKTRQDMVDLMWALDAESWRIDKHYQSSSSSMYISGTKIYDALVNAKQADGTPLCYSRGGENDSSHLKPFPNSKATQMGFDAYEQGQSAGADRPEKLPYGRNTLLFGRLSKEETGFGQDRTFIKLESFGTGGIGNMLAHGMQYVKKVALGMGKPTKESDFNEKTNSTSKTVSSFIKEQQKSSSIDISESLKSELQTASKKGLTALAKFVADQKINNPQAQPFLENLEQSVSEALNGSLKEYQRTAIDQWKSESGNENKSTLAYFETHDQSGKEMILDL
ncbi:MAG: hypothetical protein LBQ03_01640 [Puniceicoccales bacterium]|nr:hypothetical protein [Puniceicoccales bacterium]